MVKRYEKYPMKGYEIGEDMAARGGGMGRDARIYDSRPPAPLAEMYTAQPRPPVRSAAPTQPRPLAELFEDPGVPLGMPYARGALGTTPLKGPIEDAMGAIKFRGKVYTGPSHADAMQKIIDTIGKRDPSVLTDLEKLGLTDFGRVYKGQFRDPNFDQYGYTQKVQKFGRDVDNFADIGLEVRANLRAGMTPQQAFEAAAEQFRGAGNRNPGVTWSGEGGRYAPIAKLFE